MMCDDQLLIDSPSWILPEIKIRLDLTWLRRADTNPLIFKAAYLEMRTEYPNFECIYTDGLKSD